MKPASLPRRASPKKDKEKSGAYWWLSAALSPWVVAPLVLSMCLGASYFQDHRLGPRAALNGPLFDLDYHPAPGDAAPAAVGPGLAEQVPERSFEAGGAQGAINPAQPAAAAAGPSAPRAVDDAARPAALEGIAGGASSGKSAKADAAGQGLSSGGWAAGSGAVPATEAGSSAPAAASAWHPFKTHPFRQLAWQQSVGVKNIAGRAFSAVLKRRGLWQGGARLPSGASTSSAGGLTTTTAAQTPGGEAGIGGGAVGLDAGGHGAAVMGGDGVHGVSQGGAATGLGSGGATGAGSPGGAGSNPCAAAGTTSLGRLKTMDRADTTGGAEHAAQTQNGLWDCNAANGQTPDAPGTPQILGDPGVGAPLNASNPDAPLPNTAPPPDAGHANVTPYQGLVDLAGKLLLLGGVLLTVAGLLAFIGKKLVASMIPATVAAGRMFMIASEVLAGIVLALGIAVAAIGVVVWSEGAAWMQSLMFTVGGAMMAFSAYQVLQSDREAAAQAKQKIADLDALEHDNAEEVFADHGLQTPDGAPPNASPPAETQTPAATDPTPAAGASDPAASSGNDDGRFTVDPKTGMIRDNQPQVVDVTANAPTTPPSGAPPPAPGDLNSAFNNPDFTKNYTQLNSATLPDGSNVVLGKQPDGSWDVFNSDGSYSSHLTADQGANVLGDSPNTAKVLPTPSSTPASTRPPAAAPSGSGGGQYSDTIQSAAQKYGVPEDTLHNVLKTESGFQNFDANGDVLTSKAGAQGIAQFMPGTAQQYGVDVNDPASGINGAAHYLSDLNAKFGNWPDAVRAYNWGPGNVQNWIAAGRPPGWVPGETLNYVPSVLGPGK